MANSNAAVLAWNTGCRADTMSAVSKARGTILLDIIAHYQPSLIALQEGLHYADLEAVGTISSRYGVDRHERLVSLYNKSEWLRSPRTLTFEGRVLGVEIQHVSSGKWIRLWNLHLRSLLHSQAKANRVLLRSGVMNFVRDARASGVNGCEEICAGDINFPPYDDVVLEEDGLYSRRTLASVRHETKYARPGYSPLYNTSWTMLGRTEAPQGTFYRSGDAYGPWHVFDQIMMTPALVPAKNAGLRALDRVGTASLCSVRVGAPNAKVGSDHLPVICDIAL